MGREGIESYEKIFECQICDYTLSKDANPDENKFCPRCGRALQEKYIAKQ